MLDCRPSSAVPHPPRSARPHSVRPHSAPRRAARLRSPCRACAALPVAVRAAAEQLKPQGRDAPQSDGARAAPSRPPRVTPPSAAPSGRIGGRVARRRHKPDPTVLTVWPVCAPWRRRRQCAYERAAPAAGRQSPPARGLRAPRGSAAAYQRRPALRLRATRRLGTDHASRRIRAPTGWRHSREERACSA